MTAGVSALTATAADAATPQQIGKAPVAPHGAVRTGTPDGNTPLHVDVELAPRNSAALAAFVQAVSDPKSAEYKHYLAKGQFASVFGPTRATIDSVTNGLRAEGLNPGTPSSDGLTIPVDTTIAKAGAAFDTSFAGYRLANGRTTFANTSAPSMPSSVASQVSGIVGLNDFVQPEPKYTKHGFGARSGSSAHTTAPNTVTAHTPTPTVCSQVRNYLLNNFGAVDGQDYWEPGTLAPATGYNTAAQYNYGDNGQNVTVALFELENYDPADVAAYQNCWGTKQTSVTPIKVDGGPTTPGGAQYGTGFESILDIDAVMGMSPGSSILVYQGPDHYTSNAQALSDVLDVYSQMVNDDRAQVLSTSWGECEAPLISSDPGLLDAENTLFAEAAAQGQTVIAASGDAGSTDCYGVTGLEQWANQLHVDDPADQPYVTAAGGTSVAPNGSSADILSTWHNPQTTLSDGTVVPEDASGGGVSQYFSMSGSANYQQSVQGPGYANLCNAASGATCRQVPDVSALADENRGYLVGYGRDNTGAEQYYSGGGTSLAAPLWAAIAALADSGIACSANGSVGFMNPALYANPGVLNDVTTGNNDMTTSGYTGGLYVAGSGYDMTTGLGSPNAPKIVESLCGSKGAGAGSDYVAVTPQRILDTRNAVGVTTTTPVGPNSQVPLQITGANGVPGTGVTAVVLNVTAVSPTVGGYLTVYPDGTSRPASSNLNFTQNETIPNLVTVKVGSNGKIDIYNLAGNTHVLADLEGYYTTDTTVSGASTYAKVTPTRLLDTRNAVGVTTTTPVGPNSHVTLAVAGHGGVPATGATAVILNVTATAPTDDSYLSVYPDLGTQPAVSNLNFSPGETIPNLVIVPLGSDGAVDIYNHVGSTHVLADVEGYYTGDQTGLKFYASQPHRLLDTRFGNGVAGNQVAPVGANATFGLPINDHYGPGNIGPLATAGGVVLNVVVVAPTQTSYLKVFPISAGSPAVSNLNFTAGQTIPNAVVTPLGGDFIAFYNHVGTVQVVADIFGYFA